MKRKNLLLLIAALLAAAGLWFARPDRSLDPSTSHQANAPYVQIMNGQAGPAQTNNPPSNPAPPEPTRRFRDFTPEQRVQQARKGHGPGG